MSHPDPARPPQTDAGGEAPHRRVSPLRPVDPRPIARPAPPPVFRTGDIPRPVEADSQADDLAIEALRFLVVDAVEEAGSGHPGTAMALAPLAYRLYARHMRHDPSDPEWFDRDRLVLSAGHASMLLYGALHLAGYEITVQDLRRFRKMGSRTPGHPERGVTAGIDMSTGPLGQGLANGVGMAMAEKMLAARFNNSELSVVDHRTWVIAGDGDMMEGISSEAASLAGHLGLDRLTVFYDQNNISLDGPVGNEMSEDVAMRFAAYGWSIATIDDVNDVAAIDRAIGAAKSESERPTLIVVRSQIGFGSPKQGQAAAHGSPLGAADAAETRTTLGWKHGPFATPKAAYGTWQAANAERRAIRSSWESDVRRYRADMLAGDEFCRIIAGEPPTRAAASQPDYVAGDRISGRSASAEIMQSFALSTPELVGGTADVASSTLATISGSRFVHDDWTGRNIAYGVREHAMGAITNGLAAHGGILPFCSTFFIFADYLRPAIRMAAMMQLRSIWIMTHDSVAIGADGPTHQPIEQLAGFRAMPGLAVIRPADAKEIGAAWAEAVRRDGPTMIVVSRQDLPILEGEPDLAGRVVVDGDDATILATGSEVALAIEARTALLDFGIIARVISMPSWDAFRARPEEQQKFLLGGGPIVAVEAGASQGWLEFADSVVGIDRFGASGAAGEVLEACELTAQIVADRVLSLRAERRGSA